MANFTIDHSPFTLILNSSMSSGLVGVLFKDHVRYKPDLDFEDDSPQSVNYAAEGCSVGNDLFVKGFVNSFLYKIILNDIAMGFINFYT